jgi:integrase
VPTTTTRRTFGSVRRLPSGAYQARYVGPDGQRYTAPTTYDTRKAADSHLAGVRTDIERGIWKPRELETPVVPTFAAYAEGWLADRELRPRTRAHYRTMLDRFLLPTFGATLLPAVSAASVRSWHANFDRHVDARPTYKAQTYSLLKTILGTAQTDDLIASNPCRVRKAGQVKRATEPRPATLDELDQLVQAMPEKWRALVLLASWCSLRLGELTALTRADLDVAGGVVHVRRSVVRVPGQAPFLGPPKSEAGVRDVAIPAALVPALASHLLSHVGPTADSLLFPASGGGFLAPSTLYGRAPRNGRAGRGWYAARATAGRPDLKIHHLRHTGAVLSAQTGATLAELMRRLGHSTPGAAMLYQHASQDRDLVLAAGLSAFIEAQEAARA